MLKAVVDMSLNYQTLYSSMELSLFLKKQRKYKRNLKVTLKKGTKTLKRK